MSSKKKVRIGCHSGFWGDAPWAAHQLLLKSDPPLDYLVSDYLAEVTMCILARMKGQKGKGLAGDGGYIQEFVDTVWKPLLKTIIKNGTKIVTNAGGMNPLGLKEALENVCKEENLPCPVIAAITGDDLGSRIVELRSKGKIHPFSVNNEPENLWPENQRLMSCNAYLGAHPIADALRMGAQVVVTGRGVDSAVVLGPLIAEFGWKDTDYDFLSSGSLAGHILECGCHATGGNLTDWEMSYASDWTQMGYPIAEVYPDGSFIVSKPKDTGGLVSRATIAEQLVYEIHDPAAYILPDVVCDWRNVRLTELPGPSSEEKDEKKKLRQQLGSTRVLVEGARGNPPTPFFKVACTVMDGFKLEAMLLVGGEDAARKAKAVGQTILKRASMMCELQKLGPYSETSLELLGSEGTYGPLSQCKDSREVFIKIAAAHPKKMGLQLLARNLAPAALSTAPAIFGAGSARPHPTPRIRYYSCLLEKDQVPISIHVGTNPPTTINYTLPGASTSLRPSEDRGYCVPSKKSNLSGQMIQAPLICVAFGRSGDKGDTANIGIVARRPEFFSFLQEHVTESKVHQYLSHLIKGSVRGYSLPGIGGLNFVLTRSLGGGGVQSLLTDKQGKAYAQMLLTMPIQMPVEWASEYATWKQKFKSNL